jgi:mannose-6-phosphate isomerase-like protein (cupin superfamily)
VNGESSHESGERVEIAGAAVDPAVPQVRVLDGDSGAELPIVASGGTARAIVWPGTGAELRSLHRIELEPRAETVEMTHATDAVYYVVAGGGEAEDAADGSTERLVEGSMIHVDADTAYVLRAGEAGMDVVGGPAPADRALYELVGGG